jgi:hypothetical protein
MYHLHLSGRNNITKSFFFLIKESAINYMTKTLLDTPEYTKLVNELKNNEYIGKIFGGISEKRVMIIVNKLDNKQTITEEEFYDIQRAVFEKKWNKSAGIMMRIDKISFYEDKNDVIADALSEKAKLLLNIL